MIRVVIIPTWMIATNPFNKLYGRKPMKWKRGKISVILTVREMVDLIELLDNRKGFKRHLNKLVKASDWYFDYPYGRRGDPPFAEFLAQPPYR